MISEHRVLLTFILTKVPVCNVDAEIELSLERWHLSLSLAV